MNNKTILNFIFNVCCLSIIFIINSHVFGFEATVISGLAVISSFLVILAESIFNK